MKTLETGVTGLMRKKFLHLLKENGHEIFGLTRNLKTAGVRLPIACSTIEWCPPLKIFPPGFPQNIDAVSHLFGEGIATGPMTSISVQGIYDSGKYSRQPLYQK